MIGEPKRFSFDPTKHMIVCSKCGEEKPDFIKCRDCDKALLNVIDIETGKLLIEVTPILYN